MVGICEYLYVISVFKDCIFFIIKFGGGLFFRFKWFGNMLGIVFLFVLFDYILVIIYLFFVMVWWLLDIVLFWFGVIEFGFWVELIFVIFFWIMLRMSGLVV